MDFKISFFSQLQTLLQSGLSFTRAFRLIIDCATPKERPVYTRIFEMVVSGNELWRAMESEKCFSMLDKSVIRIGEETGRLVEVFEFLTEYYQKRKAQKRMIVNALSYPAITLGVAVIVLVFMLLVVVPMFEQVYARMGGELPVVTRSIVTISEYVPAILGVGLLLCIVLYAIKYFYGGKDNYRKFTSMLVMKIPAVSNIVRKYQVSRFCRIMHLLVSSSVPVLRALQLMEGIIGFYPYFHSISAICRSIERGNTLTEGMSEFECLYGRKFLALLRVGEETNSLEDMLLKQAEDTNAELEHEIRQLNNVAEPFLILTIGVIVAFVLIAMYMPMFKLGTTII